MYGNGKTVSFTYDILGRAKTTTYSDGRTLTYTYTGDGQLYRITDSKTGYTYTYSYDSLGRLTTSTVKDSDGNTLMHTRQVYDANNQLTGQQWTVGDTTYSQTFTYSKTEGNLTNVTLKEGNTTMDSFALSYDALRRLSKVDTNLLDRYYTYRDISSTQTTGQVSSYQYKIGSGNVLYSYGYEYDQFGNISSYTENGTTYTYTYSDDSTTQLLGQTGGGKTYTYTYDGAGNILTASDGTTTHTYKYGYDDLNGDGTEENVWKDLLIQFDDEYITYDTIGNPIEYYNGTRWDFTWEEGRRLVSASTFGSVLNFTYDSDGLRLTKQVSDFNNNTTYNYLYAGGKLMRQTGGGNTLDFFYDESGHPYALKYNGTTYYYVTNLQGDVLHIVNNAGTAVVSYAYDPYGKPLTTTGSMASTLGAHNPLRYRGYVFDPETGFYYLQSRYYDPTICRFINADSYASTGQGFLGYNMFAYCGNNPIIRVDDNGQYYTPGQIHDFVVEDICKNNPNKKGSREDNKIIYSEPVLFSTYGYCDIHDDITGEVWELKRFSNAPTCQFAYAHIQLSNYVNGYLENSPNKPLKFGGDQTMISPNVFTKRDRDGRGTYIIGYWDTGVGVLFYDYIYVPSGDEVAIGIAFVAVAALAGFTGGVGASAGALIPALL